MEQLLNTFTRKSMYNVTYNDNALSLKNECKMKKKWNFAKCAASARDTLGFSHSVHSRILVKLLIYIYIS